MSEILWAHAPSEHSERWYSRCESRGEVIADGRTEYGAKAFWISKLKEADPAEMLPRPEHIIDDMRDCAYDEYGDDAEEWPNFSDEAKRELRELLAAWARKHAATTALWVTTGEPERVEPEGGEK